ncbi:MAG: mechanosensitive ion channel protein MscS [Chloroflexi bacterium]|nr:MAG: mechanosensitive ion channel protein MscS [Chloroflexota bacterium]PIE80199.1 MAG: mechanosensitive ion channel protein MscS [Chloroflexota bacterium]
MLEVIRSFLQAQFQLSVESQDKLLTTFLILLIMVVLRWVTLRYVNNRFLEDPRALYNWRKASTYTIYTIGAILIGRIWLAGLQSVMTYLGILSAGLAIALQDPIVNLVGWLFIVTRRPFTVGDRIEVDEYSGDVIDIRLFQFSLLEIGTRIDAEQSTGRVLHMPNGIAFKKVFANFSQGLPFIWNEVPILVTFESDWEKAKAILVDVINNHAPPVDQKQLKQRQIRGMRFVISYSKITPTVYTTIESSGVLLTIRYLVQPKEKRDSEQIIHEAILRAFAPHEDLDFAYETQREYIHFKEKKRVPIAPPEYSVFPDE